MQLSLFQSKPKKDSLFFFIQFKLRNINTGEESHFDVLNINTFFMHLKFYLFAKSSEKKVTLKTEISTVKLAFYKMF